MATNACLTATPTGSYGDDINDLDNVTIIRLDAGTVEQVSFNGVTLHGSWTYNFKSGSGVLTVSNFPGFSGPENKGAWGKTWKMEWS